MLNGHYDRTAVADFGLGRECKEGACAKRYEGGNWRLWGRFVFVMTERTRIEDTVCLLVVLNRLVAEVDGRFRSASSKSRGVLVHVIKVVLCRGQYRRH